ncbi:MAG: T9SS type A sorting domain-containing protein, partial [Bacteroidales bacterium]|nr:T9SS type A sorting domain-containing protein [Bacteroidales bacterium]
NPMTAVRVYPNPATDVLNIEVNASQSSAMSINVFNIMGQKVMESNVNINTGMNTPSISTADFASGIYFVTVKANGFENTMKFIVK